MSYVHQGSYTVIPSCRVSATGQCTRVCGFPFVWPISSADPSVQLSIHPSIHPWICLLIHLSCHLPSHSYVHSVCITSAYMGHFSFFSGCNEKDIVSLSLGQAATVHLPGVYSYSTCPDSFLCELFLPYCARQKAIVF